MKTAHVVTASPDHIPHIAAHMRQADRDEVAASHGITPLAAMEMSLRRSRRAWTIMSPAGVPVGMFGVGDTNILAGVGSPWLLGTDELPRHAIIFLRQCPYWVGQLLEGYTVLRNCVDDRNKLSIRWLKWLGFDVGKPVAFKGQLFRMFEMKASEDV